MSMEPDKAVERYADWANLVLGGLLFLSPWVLQFTGHPVAPWHAWLGGIVVAVLAVAALAKFFVWEEWVEAVAGVWIVISPWVLDFGTIPAAAWTHVVLGVLVAGLAAIRGWRAQTHATA